MLRQMIATQSADSALIKTLKAEGATDDMILATGATAGMLARARRNGSFNLAANARKSAQPMVTKDINEKDMRKMSDKERLDCADDFGRMLRLQAMKGVAKTNLCKMFNLTEGELMHFLNSETDYSSLR